MRDSEEEGSKEYGVQPRLEADEITDEIEQDFQAMNLDHNKCYLCENAEHVFKLLVDRFDVIHAGGGFVLNDNEELLMIERRGHWDLPKGKLEQGETLAECAIREVEEECGIAVRHASDSPTAFTTYHIYREGKSAVIKASHWFPMKALSLNSTPQLEEDITAVHWKSIPIDMSTVQPCYGSIKEVLHHFGAISALS